MLAEDDDDSLCNWLGVSVCICVGNCDTDKVIVDEYDGIPVGEFADE